MLQKVKKMSTVVLLVMGLLIISSTVTFAFDLTQFGFEPVENYDFGGETVTIISWTSERMANYFNDYLPIQERVAEAEAAFNCKIDWMQTRDIPEVNFNRLLAGESVNDLWHVQNKIGYWELVAADALYSIGDLLGDQYYDMLPPSFIAVEEALKYQDRYWGIGPVEWRPIYGYQNDMMFVAYNKTLLEREGLQDPYEMYVNDEWTWNALTDLAVDATADVDGDGETDQWGLVDGRVWDLAVANGASMFKTDENGKIVFAADEPAYLQAFEQIYEWRTELQVQMPTYNSTDMNNAFINGQAAFYLSQPAYGLDSLLDMEDEWGLLPFPMGPSADRYYWTVQALNTTVIPSNAKNPEALAALRTFLWREDDVDVNDVLAAHVNSLESAEVLLAANQQWGGQSSRLFQDYLDQFETYAREVYEGTRSAAAAMAEIKPVIQSNLDDLFGNN